MGNDTLSSGWAVPLLCSHRAMNLLVVERCWASLVAQMVKNLPAV